MTKIVSIIVPVYNEEAGIAVFDAALRAVAGRLAPEFTFECIYCNDGSTDATSKSIDVLKKNVLSIHEIEFSRRFGKEAAISAGLASATGQCAIVIDSDLEHPVELISEFIARWKRGVEVVIGVRKRPKTGFIRSVCSSLFVWVLHFFGDTRIMPGATDFRLLDRKVIDVFNTLSEHDRMFRVLIDWLGFKREEVYFEQGIRKNGVSRYSFNALFRLAVSALLSHSLLPLRMAGLLGICITFISIALSLFMIIDKYILNNAGNYNFSGPALLAVLNMFLVGIVLCSIGILSLYSASIKREVSNRPLYVIRKK